MKQQNIIGIKRRVVGMSMEKLADILDCSRQTIQNLESHGPRKEITPLTIAANVILDAKMTTEFEGKDEAIELLENMLKILKSPN